MVKRLTGGVKAASIGKRGFGRFDLNSGAKDFLLAPFQGPKDEARGHLITERKLYPDAPRRVDCYHFFRIKHLGCPY